LRQSETTAVIGRNLLTPAEGLQEIAIVTGGKITPFGRGFRGNFSNEKTGTVVTRIGVKAFPSDPLSPVAVGCLDDDHWTPAGQKIAAEAVNNHLRPMR